MRRQCRIVSTSRSIVSRNVPKWSHIVALSRHLAPIYADSQSDCSQNGALWRNLAAKEGGFHCGLEKRSHHKGRLQQFILTSYPCKLTSRHFEDKPQSAGSSRIYGASLAAPGERVAALFHGRAKEGRRAAPRARVCEGWLGYCRISGTEETSYGPTRTLPSGRFRRL